MAESIGFASGLVLPLRAAKLLAGRPGLWPWAIAPLAVNAVLYVGVIALAVWLVGRWRVEVDWQFWGPVGGWLTAAINSTAGLGKWVIAMPVVFAACYFSFTTVGMIVASPFNDMLSERAERVLRGKGEAMAGGWVRSAAAVVASLIDSLAIVAQQVGWSIAVLPLLVVPVVGVIPLLLVNAWFTGRGLLDIAAARHQLRRRHTRPILRARRGQVLGLGAAMMALFAVPFAGLLMLPIGVVAGTLGFCGIDWHGELAASGVEGPAGFAGPAAIRADT